MSSRVLKSVTLAVASCLSIFAASAHADAPLKSALDLTIDQAAKVDVIQKNTRDAIRPVRGELHREERVLRRARIANDAEGIARQEKLIEPLRKKFAAIHQEEARQIRELLTPEQNAKYDEYLKIRDAMVGSSRDVKEYQDLETEAGE